MRIIKEGKTKEGEVFVLRYPEESDLQSALEYVNRLSKEVTFVRYQGEDIPLEQEEKFLKEALKRISEHKGVTLFLTIDGAVRGICGIRAGDKTESHVATFGLSIDRTLRGQGLGELLLTATIDEILKSIPELRIVTLKVKASNAVAISLYTKLGFKQYSHLPLGTTQGGEFVDELGMYKNIER